MIGRIGAVSAFVRSAYDPESAETGIAATHFQMLYARPIESLSMTASTAFDDQETVVLVPIKDFRQAKNRLSERLDTAAREALARSMAERVVKAAGNLSVRVVCNDQDVANWAQSMGADVSWVQQDGLNPAVTEAAIQVEHQFAHMIIAHADLPHAEALTGIAPLSAQIAISKAPTFSASRPALLLGFSMVPVLFIFIWPKPRNVNSI